MQIATTLGNVYIYIYIYIRNLKDNKNLNLLGLVCVAKNIDKIYRKLKIDIQLKHFVVEVC